MVSSSALDLDMGKEKEAYYNKWIIYLAVQANFTDRHTNRHIKTVY